MEKLFLTQNRKMAIKLKNDILHLSLKMFTLSKDAMRIVSFRKTTVL